jgi:hypothetical protein
MFLPIPTKHHLTILSLKLLSLLKCTLASLHLITSLTSSRLAFSGTFLQPQDAPPCGLSLRIQIGPHLSACSRNCQWGGWWWWLYGSVVLRDGTERWRRNSVEERPSGAYLSCQVEIEVNFLWSCGWKETLYLDLVESSAVFDSTVLLWTPTQRLSRSAWSIWWGTREDS